jgi:multiple sugar transport system substrate-binding protein
MLALIVSGTGLGLLAACGGSAAAPPAATTAPKPGATPAPTTAAAAAQPTAAPAQAAASGAFTVLSWSTPDTVGRQVDDKELQAYAKDHNMTIQSQDVPFGEYLRKLQTMFAANVAPDVLWDSIWRQGPFVKANALVPLDDLVAKDQSLPKFKQVALDMGKYNGKLYGLPTAASTWVLYFNADLFKAAGLQTPLELQAAKQWNWDNCLKAAQQLTKTASGRTTQYGYMTDPQFYTWATYTYNNGGEILNKDHSKFLVDSTETVTALQWLADMVVKLKASPTITDQQQEGYVPRFASGKLGMMTTWAGTGIDIQKAAPDKFKWDVIAAPESKRTGGYWHANLININAKTKDKDVAWGVCKLLASLDIEKKRLAAGISNTPLIDDADLVALYNKSMPMPNAKVVIDLLDASIPLPYNDNWEEQRFKIIEPFMQKVYAGDTTAAAGLPEAKTQLDALLPK